MVGCWGQDHNFSLESRVLGCEELTLLWNSLHVAENYFQCTIFIISRSCRLLLDLKSVICRTIVQRDWPTAYQNLLSSSPSF
jgi:hypothetical protein